MLCNLPFKHWQTGEHDTACKDGWVAFDGSCYIFQATSSCEQGIPTTVDNEQKNNTRFLQFAKTVREATKSLRYSGYPKLLNGDVFDGKLMCMCFGLVAGLVVFLDAAIDCG